MDVGRFKIPARIFTCLLFIRLSFSSCPGINFTTYDFCDYKNILDVSLGNCGTFFNADDTKVEHEPVITLIGETNPAKKYLLIMVDPDAPSPDDPNMAYWIHWIASDIEQRDISNGRINGTQVFSYDPPTPPEGIHRYQFFVFEQPSGFSSAPLTELEMERSKFNFPNYVSEQGLCDKLVATYQYLSSYGRRPDAPDPKIRRPGPQAPLTSPSTLRPLDPLVPPSTPTPLDPLAPTSTPRLEVSKPPTAPKKPGSSADKLTLMMSKMAFVCLFLFVSCLLC